MATQPLLTGFQNRNWNAYRGTHTGKLLKETIEDKEKCDEIVPNLGNLSECVDYHEQHGTEIEQLLQERERGVIVLESRLEDLQSDIQKYRISAAAANGVVSKTDTTLLQNIERRVQTLWTIVLDVCNQQVEKEVTKRAEGLAPQQYYKPPDATSQQRLHQIANRKGSAISPNGFPASDICKWLTEEIVALEESLSEKLVALEHESVNSQALKREYNVVKASSDNTIESLATELAAAQAERDRLTKKVQELEAAQDLSSAEANTKLSDMSNDLSESETKRKRLQRQLRHMQEELEKYQQESERNDIDSLRKAQRQSDEEHAKEREEWQRSEQRWIKFTKKALQHITFGDVLNWHIRDLKPLVTTDQIPIIEEYRQLGGSRKERQSIVSHYYDVQVVDPPRSDFGYMLMASLDHDTEFSSAEERQSHLKWLDEVVMPQFFPPRDNGVGAIQTIMLTLTITRLRDLLLDPTTDPLCAYWAASLLTQLACRWDIDAPSELLPQLNQDLGSLPLIQACGYLKLRMAAQRSTIRKNRVTHARIKAESETQDIATGEGLMDASPVGAADSNANENGTESQDITPLDGRFKENIEEKTGLCTLDTIDFIREVCSPNIIDGEGTGKNGEYLLIVQRDDDMVVMAVAHEGELSYFFKDGNGVRFTQSPVTVVDYSIIMKSGYAFWQTTETKAAQDGYRFQFQRGDNLHAFLKRFAIKELNKSIRQTRNDMLEQLHAGA